MPEKRRERERREPDGPSKTLTRWVMPPASSSVNLRKGVKPTNSCDHHSYGTKGHRAMAWGRVHRRASTGGFWGTTQEERYWTPCCPTQPALTLASETG